MACLINEYIDKKMATKDKITAFDNFTKDELVDIKIYGKKTKKALDINEKN